MNLIQSLSNEVDGGMLSKLSGFLGESQDKTKSALGAAIPSLLAGLVGISSTSEGARHLEAVLDKTDDKAPMLALSGAAPPADAAHTPLDSLFGVGTLNALSGAISRFTGIGQGTIGKLLGFVAPMLLGLLKKQKNALGLDAGGFAKMLAGQKDNIAAAMPAGLGKELSITPGLGAIGGAAQGFVHETSERAHEIAEHARATQRSFTSLAKRLLIPALILLGLLFVWSLIRSQRAKMQTPTMPPPAASVTNTVTMLQNELNTAVTSTSSALATITSPAEAQAALPGLRESAGKLDSLTTRFQQLPTAVRAPISSGAKGLMGKLQPMIDRAMAIPGAGEILSPVINPMIKNLETLTAG